MSHSNGEDEHKDSSEDEHQNQVIRGIKGERLTRAAFHHLCGHLAGYPFVKVVVDRSKPEKPEVHFINHNVFQFHSDYVAEVILGTSKAELDSRIDEFNQSVYFSNDRVYIFGTLSLHKHDDQFFTLETVEVDTMDESVLLYFFKAVAAHLERGLPLYFKPANHGQEAIVARLSKETLPRIYSHELHASADYLALNPGSVQGRIRAFHSLTDYQAARATLEWYDIIVMERVPDDIPRLSGIINASHTTPLSHTNVLAHGWQIPNCVQIGIMTRIVQDALHEEWVEFRVEMTDSMAQIEKIEPPAAAKLPRPAWAVQRVVIEEPQTDNVPIAILEKLRLTDRFRYGTKAAHLGELHHLLEVPSERLLGFYKIRRPPRPNLLAYISKYLGLNEHEGSDPANVSRAAWEFLRQNIRVPLGIALPFSLQQEFLEASPRIQQSLGKLKMALELNAREVEPICLTLMNQIRSARFPDSMRESIDNIIANQLAGVSSFVVRSSSNAEDLENFSAAGIYESFNHQTTAEKIFQSIKEVWASLVTPRSVRLRQEVGISLDDVWMGVIIQEEIPARLGGVLVTTNPLNAADFRNVYINVAHHSAERVVQGIELPLQYVYNTVETGGRTLSLGSATEDLPISDRELLQKLAICGRLLQSHFSPNYTFADPVDIEWLIDDQGIVILQLRPYSK